MECRDRSRWAQQKPARRLAVSQFAADPCPEIRPVRDARAEKRSLVFKVTRGGRPEAEASVTASPIASLMEWKDRSLRALC